MRLWHLKGRLDAGPWETRQAKVVGFIVRAETEAQARRLARDEAGGEDGYVWIEERFSACEELPSDGEAGVLMADFVPAQGGSFDTPSDDTIRK